MSNTRLALVMILLCAACRGAGAADETPKHLACDFKEGFASSYENGKFKSSPPSELKFEIASIDLDKQSAALILNGKPANALKIVRALNANHFLEVVNEGFLNLTTVYDRDPTTGLYPAVHSRHFGLFGQPMFAQYSGTCAEKP